MPNTKDSSGDREELTAWFSLGFWKSRVELVYAGACVQMNPRFHLLT